MASRLISEAPVIGGCLACQKNMNGMMKIIVPLRFKPRKQTRIVGIVLDHQVDMTLDRDGLTDLPFELDQEVQRRNRVDRIKPQTVEAVFAEPMDSSGDEKGADFRPVEIDRRTPWCMAPGAKELRGIGMEIAAVRAKVIENDVEMDREAKFMGPVHQSLQVIRRSVSGRRSEGKNTIVSP